MQIQTTSSSISQTHTTPHDKIGTGKTIMLAMPDVVGLCDMIRANLEHHGFTVIDGTYKHFVYTSVWERIYKFLRRTFLNEKDYKLKKQTRLFLENNLDKQFAKLGIDKVDYTLFIHASVFEKPILKIIQARSKNSVAYHWDGLSIFPEIMDYIPFFERFFVFDQDDINNNPALNLLYTTNFYFDLDNHELASLPAYNPSNPKIYFVGRHWSDRTPMINDFLNQISDFQVTPDFYILDEKGKGRKDYQNHPIHFLDKSISFEQNLENVKHTDILIDFVKAAHNGLSFRFFESIHYKKKLITNNPNVVHYDLYHPDNVFIWQNDTIDKVAFQKFIETPFRTLDDSITQKYAFGNWIKYILDIHPHTPLTVQTTQNPQTNH